MDHVIGWAQKEIEINITQIIVIEFLMSIHPSIMNNSKVEFYSFCKCGPTRGEIGLTKTWTPGVQHLSSVE